MTLMGFLKIVITAGSMIKVKHKSSVYLSWWEVVIFVMILLDPQKWFNMLNAC